LRHANDGDRSVIVDDDFLADDFRIEIESRLPE